MSNVYKILLLLLMGLSAGPLKAAIFNLAGSEYPVAAIIDPNETTYKDLRLLLEAEFGLESGQINSLVLSDDTILGQNVLYERDADVIDNDHYQLLKGLREATVILN